MKELTEQEAFNKAAAYCAGAEHCNAEIRKKMEAWGVHPDYQEKAIARLNQEKYIDEQRFCRSFIHDKLRYNQWGRIKIAQALRQKDISTQLIRETLSEVDEEEYVQVLKKILQTKAKSIKAASDYERNGKLIRFAIGRGFEMPYITRHLRIDEEDYC